MDPTHRTDIETISKVVDLNEVNTFQCYGETVFRYPVEDSYIIATNPVSVTDDLGNKVGFATIDFDDTSLPTRLFLLKESPERLDIENGVDYYIEAGEYVNVYGSGPDYNLKWVDIRGVFLRKVSTLPKGSVIPPTVALAAL